MAPHPSFKPVLTNFHELLQLWSYGELCDKVLRALGDVAAYATDGDGFFLRSSKLEARTTASAISTAKSQIDPARNRVLFRCLTSAPIPCLRRLVPGCYLEESLSCPALADNTPSTHSSTHAWPSSDRSVLRLNGRFHRKSVIAILESGFERLRYLSFSWPSNYFRLDR